MWSRAQYLCRYSSRKLNSEQGFKLTRSFTSLPFSPASTAVLATNTLSQYNTNAKDYQDVLCSLTATFVGACALVGAVSTSKDAHTVQCEKAKSSSPHTAQVAAENKNTTDVSTGADIDTLPIYRLSQVAENDGQNGRPVWMTYGGVVYDVTDFLPNHPGGEQKIREAAGAAIEPFWHVYRQHFASDLPMKLMEHMSIGRLSEQDQGYIDEAMSVLEQNDPFAREPTRDPALLIHSDTPMNAEVPSSLLTQTYLTPAQHFYIRHHHPVPLLTEQQIKQYRLKIDISAYSKDKKTLELSLDDLRNMPKTEITATLQCSGNRRSGFNAYQRTAGTPWGQGAISTATFGGVRLRDVLQAAGVDDFIKAQDEIGLEHVRFHSIDGMSASINIEKAVNPYGDVLVCYEMNGQPLPREHGFPLRVIVPGYAAVRSVKWLQKIELSSSEAEGPWQRGLNYKILPPAVTDASKVNMAAMPSMTELSLFSGITSIEAVHQGPVSPGDRVRVKARGWAWAGGGRNIVRVDVTADDGVHWSTAQLNEGAQQRFGRAWAWVFWECEIPEAVVCEDGSVRLASKAVDMAFNVQPESASHTWNVRGLGNNSWYRAHTTLARN